MTSEQVQSTAGQVDDDCLQVQWTSGFLSAPSRLCALFSSGTFQQKGLTILLLCDEQQRNARAWSRVASSMRRVVLLLLVACPLFAKPFDVEADLSRLTDAQREWLLTFEAGARLHANAEIPSSDWLRASASSAREVELGETANVLDAAADVLTNRRATFPATWDSPVYVMPFVIEGRLTDVVVAIPNPASSTPIARGSRRCNFARERPPRRRRWTRSSERCRSCTTTWPARPGSRRACCRSRKH